MLAFMRSAAENLGRYFTVRRRLPAEFRGVPLVVSPAAGLRYLHLDSRRMDADLLRNARELVRTNDVVWDIGANVGLFAFAAAALAGPGGQVLAVEPDTWLVGLLRRSQHLQPDHAAPATVLPVAVAGRLGVAEFQIASSRSCNALVGGFPIDRLRERQAVVTVTLDWLLEQFPPPDVVKIDVEGVEGQVLAGATRLLSTRRPKILCEVGHENAAVVTLALKRHGYALYDGELEPERRAELDLASYSTVALPVR